MKTLVIHPKDESTDFLKPIYKNTDWTVITEQTSKKILKEAIKEHDKIIMLGHGCEHGLFDKKFNTIIDSNYVYLLREKISVAIWCNANIFFEKYGLKGLYTGMIISEYDEALYYSMNPEYYKISESNKLFTEAITDNINKEYNKQTIALIKELYQSDNNEIIQFNKNNIFAI